MIGEFGVDEFGEPLFTPCADNSCGRRGRGDTVRQATPAGAPGTRMAGITR